MPLRGRVGRHAKSGGRNCRNWPQDQATVIALLNRIPANQGGAGGQLHPRLVDGIASDALFRAIVRFEDTHFAGQGSGFVDPEGPMFELMEKLGATVSGPAVLPATPAPPPPEPSQIDALLKEAQKRLDEGRVAFAGVIHFLLRLKAEGKTKVLDNGVVAYAFGLCQLKKAKQEFEPETFHAGSPLYPRWRLKVNAGAAIVMFEDAFMELRANSTLIVYGKPKPRNAIQAVPAQVENLDNLKKALEKLDGPAQCSRKPSWDIFVLPKDDEQVCRPGDK